MKIVGLTGGIGTGKSTVSKMLRASGLPVIDADVIARQIVVKGQPAYKGIVAAFGNGVLQDDGELDRKALGEIIFNDEDMRKKLGAITLRWIFFGMFKEYIGHFVRGNPIVVIDAPTLFETRALLPVCSLTVVVHATRPQQIARIMARNDLTEKEAVARVDAQMPIETKMSMADVLIDNGGPENVLEANVDDAVETIRAQLGTTPWALMVLSVLSAATASAAVYLAW